MKITDLNKPAMIQLRPEIDEALKALGERFGLSFRAGNGSFAGDHAKFTLEIKVDDPAIQQAAQRKEFDDLAGLFGLEPEHYGTKFPSGGKTFELIGFAPNRRKQPLKARCVEDGKTYLFGEIAVPAIKLAAEKAKAEPALP